MALSREKVPHPCSGVVGADWRPPSLLQVASGLSHEDLAGDCKLRLPLPLWLLGWLVDLSRGEDPVEH